MNKKMRDPAVVLPLCVTCMIVCSITLEVLYLIVRGPGNGHWALLMLTSYLLFNVVGNMLKFVRSNPTIRGVFLERDSVGQGWLYCYSCQTHVPPRCHHCYNCNVCVLRRDHHCTLLGQCVGHSNYRYFICSLFHGWLALLLATILNAEIFIELLHEGVSFHSLFLLLMPWMMLVTGQVAPSTFIFAFVADTCVVGLLFCFAFLALHCSLLYHGATTKEWFGGHACTFDLGWKRNLKSFLGERWYLVWISPWIESRLIGDGLNFETREITETISSKVSDY
ncbi:probable palmitoyltransferase ZDHHC24 [Spea bombifrons]|uniref:probable palmitoyltransferase ZDHHC24 n=1 Tax=Spea bombifrons TaxID=233779 RepID=UPI00234AD0DD|nr:probable palmitoyltransferase ZDHHC24 [Spea bombifrons]XP_053304944.1 probable palmitoyltransferase ZDHHC24 [Spea bombifrons]